MTAIIAGHFDAQETGHAAAACPANYIGRISPRPLLMINGTLDADYDRGASLEPLQRLARDPKQFIWMETGHTHPQEQTHGDGAVVAGEGQIGDDAPAPASLGPLRRRRGG